MSPKFSNFNIISGWYVGLQTAVVNHIGAQWTSIRD